MGILKIAIITTALLNFIVGCVSGVILVELTGDYWWFILNGVTGLTSGFLASLTLSLENL